MNRVLTGIAVIMFFMWAGVLSTEQKEIIGKDGAPMVLIPAGEFLMGSPQSEGYENEHPRHRVFLDAYYIDKYEVTNDQFKKFVDATGYVTEAEKKGGGYIGNGESWNQNKNASWKDPLGNDQGISSKMNYPVVQVSWPDATAYANYYGKRLPTEAEWEKAARAGSSTKYCFGDAERDLEDYAWYLGNQTHPVGTKKPNVFGLYDMTGNVWEWCSDWYEANYYQTSPADNPKGPVIRQSRVLRGGCWGLAADDCRSAFRSWGYPTLRLNNFGFRCVSSP
ncbi:MAG: formylglycine-generating enzyme family protein [Candidatus Omnitrophota bacterium]